jgi:chromosome segregation ATPase
MATWLLNSIEIAGGFLDGLDVRLPAGPGLICIIGPRGSGKSTLAEAIRYAMGGGYAGNKQRQDLLQENIGSAVITLRATADVAASEYVISRRFRQPPSVVTQDGRALPGVDLERGTFLPIDAYSSLEIESIADESLGDKRRMLVDELQGPEYRQLLLSLGSHRRALEANADAVKNARRRVADLTERIEEIGDVETRISMMPAPPKDQGSDLLARLTNQQHLNGREASALAKVIRLQTDLVLDLNRVVDAHERSLTATLALPRSLNALTVDRVEIIARDAVNQVRRSLEEGSAALARSDASLQVISAELASAHNAQEQEFRDLTAKNSEVSKIVEERATVEQSLATLVGLRE